ATKIAILSICAAAMAAGYRVPLLTAEPATAPAEEQKFTDVEQFEGVVRAARVADISPRFDGLLEKVNFTAGDVVKKGQLLFQFLTLEQNYLLKIDQANLAYATAELKLSDAELERTRTLQKKNVASQAELDVAVAKRDVAAANEAKAKTQVEIREITIKEFSLYAPFDGIISKPFVDAGAYITKEARETSRLATVTQFDPIHVVTEVPYDIYSRRLAQLGSEDAMKERLVARLVLPDGTEYPHSGKIISGGYDFDEKTQKIWSVAEFPNPNRLLRPGLRVTVRSMIRAEP
ncbi:MAG: efflux RND transporter periplasmic adaptor subunit, partial [Hyphomicrobium sp.]